MQPEAGPAQVLAATPPRQWCAEDSNRAGLLKFNHTMATSARWPLQRLRQHRECQPPRHAAADCGLAALVGGGVSRGWIPL